MKPYLLPLLLAAALSWTASAQTTAIPIFNPVFNVDTLQCSPGFNCFQYGITGWVVWSCLVF